MESRVEWPDAGRGWLGIRGVSLGRRGLQGAASPTRDHAAAMGVGSEFRTTLQAKANQVSRNSALTPIVAGPTPMTPVSVNGRWHKIYNVPEIESRL